ncbi:uncharacterized protein LOC113470607, partial [Diaphorina citri]|uniref:Uncharacterized protein LOC113470607 n=1 Tax=Diaphorina citri TaxID=121845 RepID=A0A3Q0JE47_DIACI
MNDPHVTSLILEIFSEQSVHCDVTNIAKTSGLIYHGILLTENKLLIHSPHSDKLVESAPREDEDESARKIIKLGDEHVISACHMELIDLYKSIDEFDIINGILAQQNNSDLKKALDAEQNSNYRKARKHYQAALDSTPLTILHDSYYSTFHWLSQWEELETALEEKVEGEWNRAWLDPCLMKHLLRAQSLKAGPLSGE